MFANRCALFLCCSVILYLLPGYKVAAAKAGGSVVNECSTPTCGATDFVNRETAERINAYYLRRHKFDGFNGCVLVAREGSPVYTGSFGYGNFSKRDTLTPESSFQLASVTKTFTSAAILKLVEAGKISLDDSLQNFFPGFPYHGITVRMLLCHRSGLPEYIYWTQDFIGKNVPYLTNEAMLDLLMTKKPAIRALPDRIFLYTNTNYALLALVIERVSGECYKQFMEENIFAPLGMNNTFICTLEDTSADCGAVCYQARRWAEWKTAFSDGVVGDKGIYSSVEDMLTWDNALKSGKVLTEESLQQAYTPQSHDRYSFARDRSHNYGLGWRLTKQKDGSFLVYHNGNWHGCNNVFARNLKNGYTIIVLGNKENEANYQIQPVWDIISKMMNMENVAASMEE